MCCINRLGSNRDATKLLKIIHPVCVIICGCLRVIMPYNTTATVHSAVIKSKRPHQNFFVIIAINKPCLQHIRAVVAVAVSIENIGGHIPVRKPVKVYDFKNAIKCCCIRSR